MEAKTLPFKNYYWDHLFESFENYCYNYFDESYESETQFSNGFRAFRKIPLFIAFLVAFHFQFLMAKNEFNNCQFTGEDKVLKMENQIAESPHILEQESIVKVDSNKQTYPNLEVRLLPILFSFAGIARKIPIYTTNCAFLN